VKFQLELGLFSGTSFRIGTRTRFPVPFICGTEIEIFEEKLFGKKTRPRVNQN